MQEVSNHYTPLYIFRGQTNIQLISKYCIQENLNILFTGIHTTMLRNGFNILDLIARK